MNDEYLRIVNILSELLDLDDKTKERVYREVKKFGIGHFLDNLDIWDLSADARNKLQIIYIVLRYMDLNRVEALLDTGGETDER